MPLTRIREIASTILDRTVDIDRKLEARGLSTPSFDSKSSSSLLYDEIAESRALLIEATEELHALMLGPIGLLTSHSPEILITLQAIYRFKLANSFPPGKDEATFEEISQRSGLTSPHVRRIIRHATTYRIFCEPRKGIIAHTAASQYLATNPSMREWLGMTVEALAKWTDSEEPNHSGFNLAHYTDETVFGELAKYPDRQVRYAAAMTWFSTRPGLEAAHIVNGFPWEALQNGTVVDVGGSHGSISIALAQSFPSLHITVQDRAEVVQEGRSILPKDLQDRVAFMEHDFFSEQPIKSADVYLLRWILHDWPDAYALKILRALVPALKSGSRVCICEHVLPEVGSVSLYQARGLRSMDLAMLEFHNAKEREMSDWTHLLRKADERFHIVDTKQPPGSRLSVMEVRWMAPDVGSVVAGAKEV